MFKGRVQKDVVENSTKGGGLETLDFAYLAWPHCSGAEKCSKLSLPRAVANNYLQHGGVWTVGRILAWWGRGGEG